MALTRGSRSWQLVTTLATMLAAFVAKKVVDMLWVTAAGKRPPDSPEDQETSFKEAATFAAVTGVVAGITRLALTRTAAKKWARPE